MAVVELNQRADQQAEKTRRKLVAAEVSALLLLRRKARSELKTASPTSVSTAIGELLFSIRRRARALSSGRLQAELETSVERVGGTTTYDVARARLTAAGYTKALFSYARHADAPTETLALKQGAKQAAFKLETAAATEVAEAFNHERHRAARELALRQGVALWKVWDATLDKRTCRICRDLHGHAVPASQEFPEGRPGDVHPRCRCVELIVTIDQVNFGRN